MDSWQSDTASYHTRQRYKEGLFQKGKDEAVKEMIMGRYKILSRAPTPRWWS
jgi:hypothetical protein